MTNWKALRDRLGEFEAEPDQLLAYLVDLRARCKDGIHQQKNSAKGDVVDLIERYPALELAATKEIRVIAEGIRDKADGQESDQELVITVRRLQKVEADDE